MSVPMEAEVHAWVALGANLGDPRTTLEAAVVALDRSEGIRVLAVSPWLRTAPVGGPPGQPPFENGVLELATTLGPRALLDRLLAVEARFGRDRAHEVRHGPRTLDLDLLLYGDERIAEPDLEVPHPRLEERLFVLRPLAALAPGRRLPRSGRTVRERVAELEAWAGET
jgi:2-amino-4-hydroxy-6-hydroxymethyldihydropteridine diphosphokinase